MDGIFIFRLIIFVLFLNMLVNYIVWEKVMFIYILMVRRLFGCIVIGYIFYFCFWVVMKLRLV